MDPNILQALDEGVSVITSTRRLSYELTEAYARHQISKGKTVWPTVQINTWDGQMQTYWQAFNAHSPVICLSPFQSQSLLAEIIEADVRQHHSDNDPATSALWNFSASAKIALDAWQLCHQWKISFSNLREAGHIDHASFGRWASALHARLRQNDWITPVQITDNLMSANWPIEHDIVLFGFDHLNEQQNYFISHYQSNGRSISQTVRAPVHTKPIPVLPFDTTRAEWQHIGAWAREKLSKNPDLKLGIITPNTEDIKFTARQCLREQLIPQFFEQPCAAPFHFSQGEALSQTPIISHALACLELLGTMAFKQLGRIFLSSYWGSDAEQQLRAILLNAVRKKIAYQFDLFQLIQALSGLNKTLKDTALFHSLHKKLSLLQTLKSAQQRTCSIANWRTLFEQCLSQLGWPNSNLNSTEFQAQQAWFNFLDDWVKLDAICPPLSLNQALSSLRQHCQQTQFQAQANIDAPIQIMGILETAELDFDAVWLAGFDERAWPVSNSTNPFIPIHQQMAAGIPEASLKLQTEYAALKTSQLLSLCEDTTLSYACSKNDIALKLSPLFDQSTLIARDTLGAPFVLNDAIRDATPEPLSSRDDIGVALNSQTARGGTGVISLQSACPFSAYAKYRLNAGADDDPEMGLNRLQRGSLMHEILANIWDELQHSDALQELISNNALDDFVTAHIQHPLKQYAKDCGLGDGFIHTEASRLLLLIKQWLMLESQRPAFKVDDTEQDCEYEINGLKLNFKLDRIDQLISAQETSDSGGARLILDYKSKQCNLKDWASERPKEPQIPLYYLALETQANSAPVLALGFAQVKQNECAFVGISQQAIDIEGITALDVLSGRTSLKQEFSEWPDLKSLFKTRIGKLALDYRQGVANVDPKSADSCTYCDFSRLCRISTQTRSQTDDDPA